VEDISLHRTTQPRFSTIFPSSDSMHAKEVNLSYTSSFRAASCIIMSRNNKRQRSYHLVPSTTTPWSVAPTPSSPIGSLMVRGLFSRQFPFQNSSIFKRVERISSVLAPPKTWLEQPSTPTVTILLPTGLHKAQIPFLPLNGHFLVSRKLFLVLVAL
jgi:hypothetical protein